MTLLSNYYAATMSCADSFWIFGLSIFQQPQQVQLQRLSLRAKHSGTDKKLRITSVVLYFALNTGSTISESKKGFFHFLYLTSRNGKNQGQKEKLLMGI